MNRKDFALIPRNAGQFVAPMAKRIKRVFANNIALVAGELERGQDIEYIMLEHGARMQKALDTLKAEWAMAYALDGYELAGSILGKRDCLLRYEAKAGSVEVASWGHDEIVAQFMKPRIAEWVEATSNVESKTSAKRYQSIIRKAFQGWKDPKTGEQRAITRKELALVFEAEGLADSNARAEMMAKTLTHWAYNEGTVTQYENTGIQYGEWMAILDEVTGEWDEALNGIIIPLRENYVNAGDTFTGSDGKIITVAFDIAHPPLHPNCRCTVLPVL